MYKYRRVSTDRIEYFSVGTQNRTRNQHIISKMEREAKLGICGDETCTPTNIETSCFAVEFCATSHSQHMKNVTMENTSFSTFISQPYAYIAIATSNEKSASEEHFAGCITAAPVSVRDDMYNKFRDFVKSKNSFIISNLCVPAHYRNRGVGDSLLIKIIEELNKGELGIPYIYIIVMHVRNYEDRTEKLITYYSNRNFKVRSNYPSNGLNTEYTLLEYDIFRT